MKTKKDYIDDIELLRENLKLAPSIAITTSFFLAKWIIEILLDIRELLEKK